jgi:hypothetical protein
VPGIDSRREPLDSNRGVARFGKQGPPPDSAARPGLEKAQRRMGNFPGRFEFPFSVGLIDYDHPRQSERLDSHGESMTQGFI